MGRWYLTGVLTLAGCLCLSAPAYAKEAFIPDGIYAGDLSLGGMTGEEAERSIRESLRPVLEAEIRIRLDNHVVSASAQELGVQWTNPEIVSEAEHAADGNLIRQFMSRVDLKKKPIPLMPVVEADGTALDHFVQEACAEYLKEPSNAKITRVDGAFEITPEQTGRMVDTAETKKILDEAMAAYEGDGPLEIRAVITEKKPDITRKMLSTIQDVLGTFSTDFSSSGASRAGNLRVGSSKINGAVLLPGETLSGYEYMHPFTTENGYYTAAAYENGRVVDSVGGGVCQIATTLYNAALRAELEITQRQNHSMVVGYVEPSMDAAIAGTYKDIKITNNYSTPIYVEGGVNGKTLYFTIYGKETRPANRSVSYLSETLSTFGPGAPTERVDPSLPPGTRRQVQSAHVGKKSRLWKVVTVDGIEKERSILHEDTYNPGKAIVLVGPAAPAPTEPQGTEQPEAATEPEANPGNTQAASTEVISQPEETAPAEAGPGVVNPSAEPVPEV